MKGNILITENGLNYFVDKLTHNFKLTTLSLHSKSLKI